MTDRSSLKKFSNWKKESEPIDLIPYRDLPGRLNTGQAARLLGFAEHDIPVLVANKLLIPLGDPAPNARKYFAKSYVVTLAEDVNWLHTATHATSIHWQKKNSSRENGSPDEITVTA